MWSICEFCDELDHEFEGIATIKNIFGVKLDGEYGVKKHCSQNNLKSADFLLSHNNQYYFLEFSDLARQINQIHCKIQSLKASKDLDKSLRKELIKDLHKAVNQEVHDKYKDTCLLFSLIPKYLNDVPSLAKGCNLLVIYAPLGSSTLEHQVEVVRFLEFMADKLKQMIPDDIFHDVEVVTLDMFLKKFC
jgi:hypothetical protein